MQRFIRLMFIFIAALSSFPSLSQTVIIGNMEYKVKNPQTLPYLFKDKNIFTNLAVT